VQLEDILGQIDPNHHILRHGCRPFRLVGVDIASCHIAMPSVEGGNHPISLDGRCQTRDSAGMITQPYNLYVERIAPEKNMARFYALALQPTLFGGMSLVRAWGWIGARGQQMVHLFESLTGLPPITA
jgi:hypothetical protein